MKEWDYKPARDLGLPVNEQLRSLRRESGLGDTLVRLGWWSLTRAYFRVAHRLEIRGRENLPKGPPFILAANHTSHLDALALALLLPLRLRECTCPIAAGDTFFETLAPAAFAAICLNALPMWRRHCGRHAMADLRSRLLEEPCGYILFPEGTRSRTGRMGPFKPGIGMLVAGTNAPVTPCHIRGAYEALPPQRRVPRPAKIVLRVGPSLVFVSESDDREGWGRIARKTEDAVRELAGGHPAEDF
ncbi:MAG: lysophospholipid acyltransferase family protein [Candidatus Sumerlaeota bacterium]|nr:lysophospholipid acyltransferase family protein [Candidatus Sumerlaeota bacterium]